MSLQIWYPFNKDLKNYGLSESTSVTSTSLAADGKLGKYGHSTTVDSLDYQYTMGTPISLTGWFYVDYSNIKSTIEELSYSSNANYATGCLLGYASYSGIGIVWTSNDIYNSGSFSSINIAGYYRNQTINYMWTSSWINLPTKTWAHYALTMDGTTIKFYINGKLISSGTVTDTSSNLYDMCINFSGIYGGNGPRTSIPLGMNDIRVYDHCLSAKEVAEIAKGLILHYPMNQIDGTIGGRNLLTFTLSSGYSTDTYQAISVGQYNVLRYATLAQLGLSASDSVTLSLDIKPNSEKKLRARIDTLDDSGNYAGGAYLSEEYVDTSTGEKRLSVTVPSINSACTQIRWGIDANLTASTITTSTTEYTKGVKLEKGISPSLWTPAPEDSTALAADNIIYDASGFGNHGSVTSASCPAWSNDAVLGEGSYDFSNYKKIQSNSLPTAALANSYTVAYWAHIPNHAMCWGFADGNRLNGPYNGLYWNTGDGSSNPFLTSSGAIITAPSTNAWHHYAITGDGTSSKLYIDGELYGTAKTYKPITGSIIYLNGWDGNNDYSFNGLLNDFRIYTTALSPEAVKELYNTRFSIARNGALFCNEVVETGDNLIDDMNDALFDGTYTNGLNRYTQTDCSVNIVNNKLYVYRPPNNDGSYTWGGPRLQIQDKLQRYHTYILMSHVEGQSSNSPTMFRFANNMGWEGGGLEPTPSNTESCPIPANFQGEMDWWYKFTINDELNKVCITSYSNFVAGNTYSSYRDFAISWGYQQTGTLGTALYFSNFRLYDITDWSAEEVGFLKTGNLNLTSFSETDGQFRIGRFDYIKTNLVYEN